MQVFEIVIALLLGCAALAALARRTRPGYFLYYPSRRHQPAALTALIQALRL